MAGRSAKIATKVFIRNMIDEMLPVQRKPSSLTTWPICKVIAVRILLRAWGVDSKEFPHLSKQDYRIPLLLTDYSLCHVNRRHGAVFVIQIHRFFFYLEYFPIPPSRRGPTHRQRGKYFHCPSLTSAERSDDRVTLDYILSLSVDRRAIWTFGSYFFLAGQYPLFDDLKWRTVPLRRRRQERTDSRWFHWM